MATKVATKVATRSADDAPTERRERRAGGTDERRDGLDVEPVSRSEHDRERLIHSTIL